MTNMNLPTIPGSSISGRKAAMVVATAASTGRPTSPIDSSAASRACMPRSMRKYMASTRTTASSTSMPSTMTMPKRTETFRVKPTASSRTKVPITEKTTPSATRAEMREPRKSQQVASTSSSPTMALLCMIPRASRVATVWSSARTSLRPLPARTAFLRSV